MTKAISNKKEPANSIQALYGAYSSSSSSTGSCKSIYVHETNIKDGKRNVNVPDLSQDE